MSQFINSSPFRREYRILEARIEEVQSYHETFCFWKQPRTMDMSANINLGIRVMHTTLKNSFKGKPRDIWGRRGS